MTQPRILVVGAGATGGYFGGRLAQASRDVTFLARPDRAGRLRERGLRILTEPGRRGASTPSAPGVDESLTEAIDAVVRTPDELEGTFDLALVTVKAAGLGWAIEHTAPALAPGGVVVPLLNGMAQIENLTGALGADHVVGGSIRIVTHLNDGGDVVWHPPLATLTIGELTGGVTDRTTALGETLDVAGIDVVVSPDITGELWRKWYFIVAAGVIGILARGRVGDIVATDGGARLVEDVLGETTAVAAAAGHPVDEASLAWSRAFLTEPDSRFVSSLYRDVAAGRAGESEHLVGDFTRRAAALGIRAPLCDLALLQARVATRA